MDQRSERNEMNKQTIIRAALDLPEYERKQVAMMLIASTLTEMAAEETSDWAFEAQANIHGAHPRNHGFCPPCSSESGTVTTCLRADRD